MKKLKSEKYKGHKIMFKKHPNGMNTLFVDGKNEGLYSKKSTALIDAKNIINTKSNSKETIKGDLKKLLSGDWLEGSSESHLEGWFSRQYRGKLRKDIKYNLFANHDNSLEIEKVEEKLKRELNDKEIEYLTTKFNNEVIKNIDFVNSVAVSYRDTLNKANY